MLVAFGVASPFLLAASCRAASVAAFAMWISEKSSSVSLREFTCRYPTDAIVLLFLVAEAALHGGRTQCPDHTPGCAYWRPHSVASGLLRTKQVVMPFSVCGTLRLSLFCIDGVCCSDFWPLTPVSLLLQYSIHSCSLAPPPRFEGFERWLLDGMIFRQSGLLLALARTPPACSPAPSDDGTDVKDGRC